MTASFRSKLDSSYYYGSATLTLAKPAGVVEGDVLVAVMLNLDASRTLNTYTGWTIERESSQGSPTGTKMWVLSKKAGASEPASYSFVFSGSFDGAANIIAFKDADAVHVDDAAPVSAVDSSSPYPASSPTITTTLNDCLLVSVQGLRVTSTGGTPTYTQPDGYTTRLFAGVSYENRFLAVADKTLATAGASGAAAGEFQVTGTPGDGRTHAVHLAISPAVSSYVARPESDVSAGTFSASSGSDLYAMIDEEVADDGDYVTATSAGTCEVALSTVNTPPAGWITTIRYRILGDCTVKLMQDSTEIASWAHSPGPGTATTYAQTLSSGEQATISDWSDLRLRFIKP